MTPLELQALQTREFETSKRIAFGAVVEERGKRLARVRLNFVVTKQVSSKEGRTSISDTPIHDAESYRRVFDRIDEAIFVRKASD